MKSSTVRIDNMTKMLLKELAEKEDQSMQAVLQEALEEYRRKLVLKEYAEAYARLRTDEKAWAEELKERAEWDNTIADGLEGDEA